MEKTYKIQDSTPSTIPASLSKVLLEYSDLIQTSIDNFFAVLHCLMIETGFSLFNQNSFLQQPKENSGGRYSLLYKHDRDNNQEPSLFCLNLLTIGPTTIVSLHLSSKLRKTCTLKVTSISEFVQGFGSNLPLRFRNLDKLSLRFKEELAFPLLSELWHLNGVDPGPESILNLPCEIIFMICSYLKSEDVERLSFTCKVMSVVKVRKRTTGTTTNAASKQIKLTSSLLPGGYR